MRFPVRAAALGFFTLLRLLGSRRKWPEAGMIASVSTSVFFTFLMFVNFDGLDARFAALMTVFLAWRHKQNFRNLISGPKTA